MTITIMQGDCLEKLKEIDSDSIHCCVSSPPYWGLRDYGVVGQIGLEGSLGEHIDMLVRVFEEVRRVLRKDGTLWLNYGDAYASAPNGRSAADTKAAGNDDRTFRDKPISTVGPVFRHDDTGHQKGRQGRSGNLGNGGINGAAIPGGRVVAGGLLKAKDRMLLPARVAIALQEAGWWVRDEIIWHKPNPMPSSVKDRTTPAHEMIYMLSKSPRYYYDHEAVREPRTSDEDAKTFRGGSYVGGEPGKRTVTGNKRIKIPGAWDLGSGAHGTINRDGRTAAQYTDEPYDTNDGKRNKRSVWTIAPKPFPEAHFATFPPDLIEPCILAGCPEGGTVLDPFFGAGTTALVAARHGRNCIGIELNPGYIGIAKRRLGLAPKLVDVFA
jgi:DNA modification methylase